jgi:hypothetical protein
MEVGRKEMVVQSIHRRVQRLQRVDVHAVDPQLLAEPDEIGGFMQVVAVENQRDADMEVLVTGVAPIGHARDRLDDG